MLFLELTQFGTMLATIVNADRIQSVVPEDSGRTRLWFSGEDYIDVNEKFSAITATLRANGRTVVKAKEKWSKTP